jgi:hypothetical protein
MEEKYIIAKAYANLLRIMGYETEDILNLRQKNMVQVFNKAGQIVGTIKVSDNDYIKVNIDDEFIKIKSNDDITIRPNVEFVIDNVASNTLSKITIKVTSDIMTIEVRKGYNVHCLFIDQRGENRVFAVDNYMAINQEGLTTEFVSERDIEMADILYNRIVAKRYKRGGQSEIEKAFSNKKVPLLYYDVNGFIYDFEDRSLKDIDGLPNIFNHFFCNSI